MAELKVRGLTLYSYIWECIVFGGFIYANEFNQPKLVLAYEWFFYFLTALSVAPIFIGFSTPKFRYTTAKFHWEIVSNALLGLMLAYYGYFVCASVAVFMGWAFANRHYYIEEHTNEKTEQ